MNWNHLFDYNLILIYMNDINLGTDKASSSDNYDQLVMYEFFFFTSALYIITSQSI